MTAKRVNAAWRKILQANYYFGKYKEVIWLLGDGRSGTTWVSDLINYQKKFREMFEPFHPKVVPEINFIEPHQYVRPYDLDERLMKFAKKIFTGAFTHSRVNSGHQPFVYRGLLIKDIFANLLCFWAVVNFSDVRPVLLMRNPFAVALSKYRKKNWFWMTEPTDFLRQSALYEDYLFRFEDLIQQVSYEKNYILNQVLIWSIIHYIPLCQFKSGDLYVCFYEDIYNEPSQEISKILQFVKRRDKSPVISIPKDVVEKPSRVSNKDRNFFSGPSPTSSWKEELPSKIIDDGLKILHQFGFDNLYDDMSMPNREVLNTILGSS
ncbi:MAG: hypothetical protein CSB23_04180 [Deltaproteobacteria bacterium]|nr:MAG: hypothetical protein CSB23_04180 [Deltaproteobacteria bacterium]